MRESLFAASAVFLLVAVILIIELHDRKIERRNKDTMENGVRARGLCTAIRKQGMLDARNVYPWSIVVEFEFDGKRYSIEEKSVQKPIYSVGDRVTVHVNVHDPWHSIVIT